MSSELVELHRNLIQTGAHLKGAVQSLQTAGGYLFEGLQRVPRLQPDDIDQIKTIAKRRFQAASLEEPKTYVVLGCAFVGGAIVCAATQRSKKLAYLISASVGAVLAGMLACRIL